MDIIQDLKTQFSSYYDSFIVLLPKLLLAIILSGILLFILNTIRRRTNKYLSRTADDKLLITFINNIARIVISALVILLFMYIIGLGGIAGGILGAAGLSAFVIGFALKDIGENFLAGVIMAFDRPFRLGDTVMTGSVEGVITQMSLRDTHIKTFDGKDVYVPNGQILKSPLYNYTIDGLMRLNFTIGIDYKANIDKARELILDAVKATPGVLGEEKPPRTHVKNLTPSQVEIEAHLWINTFNKEFSGLEVKSMAQSNSIQALAEGNIGMPADIIELKNYDGKFVTENLPQQQNA